MLPWWSHDVGHVTVLSQFLNFKPQRSMIQLQVAQPASLRSSNKNSWTSCWVLEAYSCNARSRVLAKGFGDQVGIHRAHWNCFQLLLGFVVSLDHLSVDWSTGKMTGTPMAHSWYIHGKNRGFPFRFSNHSNDVLQFRQLLFPTLPARRRSVLGGHQPCCWGQCHLGSNPQVLRLQPRQDLWFGGFCLCFFCWNFQQPKKKWMKTRGNSAGHRQEDARTIISDHFVLQSFWHRPNIKEITPFPKRIMKMVPDLTIVSYLPWKKPYRFFFTDQDLAIKYHCHSFLSPGEGERCQVGHRLQVVPVASTGPSERSGCCNGGAGTAEQRVWSSGDGKFPGVDNELI